MRTMPKKICFVSLNSYPLLVEKATGSYGGSEVQTTLLAKELLNHGFEVTFITYNFEFSEIIDEFKSIKIISCMNNNDGKITKIMRLWKAMSKANAEIYYHHAGGAVGIIALFSYLKRKKYLLHVASDGHFYKRDGFKFFTLIDKLGLTLDILLANVIITQNEFQRNFIRKHYKKSSIILKTMFPIPKSEFVKEEPPAVLWVGSIMDIKQPELFLDLAQELPMVRFIMIGGSRGDEMLDRAIEARKKSLPNLEFLGYVPFDQIDRFFEKSSVFVNTSKFEGFPITFIQAWSCNLPVVSLNADPDEIICKNKLGYHSSSFEKMVADVQLLIKNVEMRRKFGANGRKYVENNHDIKKNMPKYLEIIIPGWTYG